MREIQTDQIRNAVRDMCIEAYYSPAPDMKHVFEEAVKNEESLTRNIKEKPSIPLQTFLTE